MRDFRRISPKCFNSNILTSDQMPSATVKICSSSVRYLKCRRCCRRQWRWSRQPERDIWKASFAFECHGFTIAPGFVHEFHQQCRRQLANLEDHPAAHPEADSRGAAEAASDGR